MDELNNVCENTEKVSLTMTHVVAMLYPSYGNAFEITIQVLYQTFAPEELEDFVDNFISEYFKDGVIDHFEIIGSKQ